jgi:hypothetical protein
MRLAAALGHRLGEVGEEAGEPEPEADLQVEAEKSLNSQRVVRIEPIQTTNMTRFLISSFGWSFLKAPITAWRTSDE